MDLTVPSPCSQAGWNFRVPQVVVDDSEVALAEAKDAGATTVLVTASPGESEAHVDLVIGGIGDLPEVLSDLGGASGTPSAPRQRHG